MEQVGASVIFLNFESRLESPRLSIGDSLQQKIITWLSPPDPLVNHHIACESRQPGSAAWFIQSNTFSEWKMSGAPSCLLWVYGKRSSMPNIYAYVETEVSFSQRVRERAFFGMSDF